MIEGFHIIEEVKKDLKNIFFKDDDETFYHSMRVYHKTILYHGTSFQLLIIALLHDVIEDTKYTIDDLKLETTRFLLTPENEEEYYNRS